MSDGSSAAPAASASASSSSTSMATSEAAHNNASARASAVKDPVTDVYLDLLLQEADDFARHLQPVRKPPSTNEVIDHPIAGPSWSQAELDLFFHAIARYSKLRPDLIAKDVGTKTLPQVCLYIKALERGLSEIEAAELEITAQGLPCDSQGGDDQQQRGSQQQELRTERGSVGAVPTPEQAHDTSAQALRSASATPVLQPSGAREHTRTSDEVRDESVAQGQTQAEAHSGAAAMLRHPSNQGVPLAPDAAGDPVAATVCVTNKPGKRQTCRALWRLREQRWRLMPAAREMNADWLEFEEEQARIIADRSAAVAGRLSAFRDQSFFSKLTAQQRSAPGDKGTSLGSSIQPGDIPVGGDATSAATSAEGSQPTRAEQRAMMLYSASLPISYDEQVAATMLYLRHRPRLDPGRISNVTLSRPEVGRSTASDGQNLTAELRAFSSGRFIEAFLNDSGDVSKDYAAFSATHPVVPIAGPRDVFRALLRAVELGFIVALQVSEESAGNEEGAGDERDEQTQGRPARRKKLAKLYDESIAEQPRSTSSRIESFVNTERMRFSWADSLDSAAPAFDSVAPVGLAEQAERGRRLFLEARREARARLLASLTPDDLRRCNAAYRLGSGTSATQADKNFARSDPDKANPGDVGVATPDAKDAATRQSPKLASPTAGPSAAASTSDAQQKLDEKPAGLRFIYHGEDTGVDLSTMLPEVRQSTKARIRAAFAHNGMEAVRDYVDRLDKHGRLTEKKGPTRAIKRSLKVLGHDMGVDLSGLSKEDYKIITQRIRARLRRKGAEDARQYCARLQESLSQGLSIDDVHEGIPKSQGRAVEPNPPQPDDGTERPQVQKSPEPELEARKDGGEEDRPDPEQDLSVAEETVKPLKRRRDRMAQIGLAEAALLRRGSLSGPGTKGQVAAPLTTEDVYLLSDELQRAITVFPGIIGMLEEPYAVPEEDGDEITEAEAHVAQGPRRIDVDALASLWAHLRSFLTEVIFSLTTLLEPYSLDSKQALPHVPPIMIYAAVARLGYPHSLPGLIDAVGARSEYPEVVDWTSQIVDELGRKAMQIDPPIRYDEVYRPDGAPKIDPDLIDHYPYQDDDDDGSAASGEEEDGDEITLTVRNAYRLQRPGTGRAKPGGDRGLVDIAQSRASSSNFTDGEDDVASSGSFEKTSDPGDSSEFESDGDVDDATSSPPVLALSDLDTSLLSTASLRCKIDHFLLLHRPVDSAPSQSSSRRADHLLRKALRDLRASEKLELDMLDRIDLEDDDMSHLEAEELMRLFRGWDQAPRATEEGGENDRKGERKIERHFDTKRRRRRPPSFLQVRSVDGTFNAAASGPETTTGTEQAPTTMRDDDGDAGMGEAPTVSNPSISSLGKRKAVEPVDNEGEGEEEEFESRLREHDSIESDRGVPTSDDAEVGPTPHRRRRLD